MILILRDVPLYVFVVGFTAHRVPFMVIRIHRFYFGSLQSRAGSPSKAEQTEYRAEERSDRAKHAKDDRGNGIQHHFDRVQGRARRDHDNAATRCDKQRRERAEDKNRQQKEEQGAHGHRGRNASSGAARRRRPFDRLLRCVHNRLSRDSVVQRHRGDSGR